VRSIQHFGLAHVDSPKGDLNADGPIPDETMPKDGFIELDDKPVFGATLQRRRPRGVRGTPYTPSTDEASRRLVGVAPPR
jgi:hypothetical protein